MEGAVACGRTGDPPVDIAALDDASEALYRIRGGAISMIFQEPMSALSPVHTVGNQICEAILLHQDVTPKQAQVVNLLADLQAEFGLTYIFADPGRPAPGCSFHPRCPSRFTPCDRHPPPALRNLPDGRHAACHRYDAPRDVPVTVR